MPIIVTDKGFAVDDWAPPFLSVAELRLSDTGGHGVTLPVDQDPAQLLPYFDQVGMFRVPFENFADGRGFSVARRLRLLGFSGRLRAAGHILADQYRNARRSGFDEVEIDEARAARQPENQWRRFADWQAGDYRRHLRKSA